MYLSEPAIWLRIWQRRFTIKDSVSCRYTAVRKSRREHWRTDPEFLAQAAELKKAHDREAQAQFSNDLKTIRAAYPDEKAQKVEELGIEFLKLCAGGISPLVAYEAIRNEKARSAANPPSMGDVKTSPTTEKEFFTRAEVAAMDQATVSRYFDKIRKSQQYWK